MTKEYFDGFMQAAKNAGINEKQAFELFTKTANHLDAAGLPPEAAGLPPEAAGAPPGGDPGAGGIPPELEQLLSTPEGVQMLMQLVQQIEHQQGGPAGHAETGIEPGGMAPGGDPGAGGPPTSPEDEAMMQQMMAGQAKQGSAEYVEGFLKAAIDYGFSEGQAIDIYKEAMKNKAPAKGADKKSRKDYDNDGKVETGKEEYFGSRRAKFKPSGKRM